MTTLWKPVEQLVEEAHRIKRSIDTLTEDLAAVKSKLVEVASERRGKENTVRLEGPDGITAVIRFTQSISYDAKRLFTALEIIKARAFNKFFSTVTSYRARPALETFLQAPGNVAAKRAIAEATKVTDNAPKLTFEQYSS